MDPDPKVRPDPAHLATMPLFESLSRQELEAVAKLAKVVRSDADRRLVGAGTPGYSFFVIQEGTAVVTRDGNELAQLGPGDFFGEIALLETERRTASVIAETPMRLIVMFQREFRQMERELPPVADRVRAAIRARLDNRPVG